MPSATNPPAPVQPPTSAGSPLGRFVALAAAAAALYWQAENLPLQVCCLAAALLALGSIVAVVRIAPRGVWSICGIYLLVLGVFHFGAAALVAVGIDPEDAMAGMVIWDWFYGPYTGPAAALAAIGYAMCALGMAVALGRRAPPAPAARQEHVRDFLSLAGTGVLGLAVASWLGSVVAQGGIRVLLGSYQAFLESARPEMNMFLQLGIAVGMTLLAAARDNPWRWTGYAVFALWTLLTLPLGLRSGVLFPLAGAVAVYARRRLPMSAPAMLISVAVLLGVISMVKQVRQTGLSDLSFEQITSGPFGGLAELGYSIRPVAEVVRWIDEGDPLLKGGSYWAPFRRIGERLTLGAARLDAWDDDSVLNALVRRRAGNVGFSTVAEAYYNFGAAGVAVILFSIGFLMGRMDRWPVSPFRDAAVGVIAIPLLIHVRNSFVPVPVQIIGGLMILACLRWIAGQQASLPAGSPAYRPAAARCRP